MKVVFSPEQDQYLQLAQTRAYYEGLCEGVTMYAHWKDGIQYVGTTGSTLKEALALIRHKEQEILTKFNRLQQV